MLIKSVSKNNIVIELYKNIHPAWYIDMYTVISTTSFENGDFSKSYLSFNEANDMFNTLLNGDGVLWN